MRHPFKAGPFYLALPINTQPAMVTVNLASLPTASETPRVGAADPETFREAGKLIGGHGQIVIKVGGGGRRFGDDIRRLAEAAGATVVLSPGSLGVLPNSHAQNIHVGGSKGSISGNFEMENATLLIAIGTRAVCQSDCSGVGYPRVRAVINLNGDLDDMTHYNSTLAIPGDIGANLKRLNATLAEASRISPEKKSWLAACAAKKVEWARFKVPFRGRGPSRRHLSAAGDDPTSGGESRRRFRA